ncbi:SDR family oxidoreductase [Fulvivirga sediminis]|uniref:SDR family oxidoreductase n=1 Tax=Fulvivirga sediminis TaxID=2803949 RepID=A0A937FDV1_9BACT|nr:SDR family NAD(P)-dependent oxidoreductase [Fulvivirga sediminis]MBL3658723.1 SDR family oxidoreductase [Fulvivirga sediminis]
MIITGSTILITGGSSGIGFALAKKFLSLGNKVIITGRNQGKLDRIKANFPNIITFKGDVSDRSSLDDLIVFIEQQHAEINILINNAAVQYNYDFISEPDLTYKIDYEVAVNIKAPMTLTGLLLPLLLKNKNSAIVNVSSGLFIAPKQSAAVYCASKSALHSFTKTLRYQLEDTSVKVFEIIPSLVDTPMTTGRGKSKIKPEELVAEFMKSFEKDRFEIYIGKTKLLKFIHRLSPKMSDKIMKTT